MRRLTLLCILVGSIFLCTGCWDSTEVEQRAIVSMAGVDTVKTDGGGSQILYSAQIARPSALGGPDQPSAGSSAKAFVVEQGKGMNISDAMEQTQLAMPRKFFLGHRRVIIFGEDLAKKGVAATIDEIVHNPESRLRTYILIAYHDSALNVLTLAHPLSRLPSDALWELEQSGQVVKVDATQFLRSILGEGDPYAMGVTGQTLENGKTAFQLKHIAVFRNDKLVGWLNAQETRGFIWTSGHFKDKVTTVMIPGHGTISSKMLSTTTHIKTRVVDGKPSATIIVRSTDDIYQNATNLDLRDPKSLQIITDELNRHAEDEIRSMLVATQQRYDADIVHFSREFNQHQPKAWKTMQRQWHALYRTMPIQVDVKISVRRSGFIVPSILNRQKENTDAKT